MYNLPIESIDMSLGGEWGCRGSRRVNIGSDYKVVVEDKEAFFKGMEEVELVVDRVGEMGLGGVRYGLGEVLRKERGWGRWRLEYWLVMVCAALCLVTVILAIGWCVFKKKQREAEEGGGSESTSWLSRQLTEEAHSPYKKADSDIFDGV